MSPEKQINVKLCHLTVRVPVIEDEMTTMALVDQVNDIYDEIAGSAVKVDTQAFAAQTALHFATELMRLKKESRRDYDDMVKVLDSAVGRLDEIIDEYGG